MALACRFNAITFGHLAYCDAKTVHGEDYKAEDFVREAIEILPKDTLGCEGLYQFMHIAEELKAKFPNEEDYLDDEGYIMIKADGIRI